MRRWLWTALSIGALASLLQAPPAAGAAWMTPPTPYRPKDFTLVKKDGVYHLFYIRHNYSTPPVPTEIDFGHATSYDLYNWTQQPPILPVRPDNWDNLHVWAPTIVQTDSTYTMLYCGVTDQPGLYNSYQRIGMATSADLYDWTRLDQPVFSCDQVPWAVCDSTNFVETGFRDPFVMPDPAHPGGWLMAYTANSATDSASEVIALAASSGDPTSWSDVKPLWITWLPTSGSSFAESPHIFPHNGLWFVFFTVDGPQPIAFATSTDPRADLDGWTWGGSLDAMLGLPTNSWFASEYLRDGTQEYFCYVNGNHIEINLMRWTAPDQFAFDFPPIFHVVSLTWAGIPVQEGQPAALRLATVNGTNATVNLETLVLDAAGRWKVVPPDSLGMPAAVTVTGDTTICAWTTHRWPSGSSAPTTILVRTVDQTAVTGTPLVVNPLPPPPHWPFSSGPGDSEDRVKLHIGRSAPARLAIEVETSADVAARLEIYDVQGRRVITLARGTLSRGSHVFQWNGRGAGGSAGAGVYLVRLTTPATTRVARVALLP